MPLSDDPSFQAPARRPIFPPLMRPLDPFPASRTGTIVSLHRSNGGVPKLPVDRARVTASGMEGDRQRNLNHHGGSDRALCLYSFELIQTLRAEGHPVGPGTMGENVLIRGLSWGDVLPGVGLRLGEVETEVTAFAYPCKNISGSFQGGHIERVSVKTHPGWSRVYARVTREGVLSAGDDVVIL
jgi:MOSC domain-containing protein YiiM